MARAKGLNVYPKEYWELVKAAATENKKFVIPLATMTEGLKRQGRYYAFRGALRREVLRLSITHPGGGEWPDIVKATLSWSEEVACWIERGDPPTIHFMHRSFTPEALSLRAMLDAGGSKPELQQIEDELAARFKQSTDGGKYG